MDEKVIQIKLSEETHKRFKSASAIAGQSIKEALIELIHYYIDNQMNLIEEDAKK